MQSGISRMVFILFGLLAACAETDLEVHRCC